ncbi:hydrolase TatD [Propionigenium maris DSM 9537]|uniref:Hydrolase TatD n=1 Tax=Propionigenium maris DSM 9537 TaxID=1123000 RepID=A0A9W6GI70_9FUSO|nr:TatD family hydrolase [Propionigenium maris]GLI55659.1 hydrolase TatD [Propionigenium maris DSM 9537]
MKLIDSHCHLDNERFDSDRDEVLARIEERLEFAVNIGYDLESSKRSVELAESHDYIYAVVGVHPTDIGIYSDEVEAELEALAKHPKVLAVGEVGLDYHWMTDPKEKQQEIFRKQMEMARRVGKPVVIHTREATRDTLDILKEYPDVRGIVHCYPGSYESAAEIMDNYYFGVGGVLTFKNSKKLKETVEKLPMDRIVIETDCPYLTPEPYRGKRNEPVYVEYIAQRIAEVKGISYEEVVRITNENTKKAYGMVK